MSQSVTSFGNASRASQAAPQRHQKRRANAQKHQQLQQLQSQQQQQRNPYIPYPPPPPPTYLNHDILLLQQQQPPTLHQEPQFIVNGQQVYKQQYKQRRISRYSLCQLHQPTNRPTFDIWNLSGERGTDRYDIQAVRGQWEMQEDQRTWEYEVYQGIVINELHGIWDHEDIDVEDEDLLKAWLFQSFRDLMPRFDSAFRPRHPPINGSVPDLASYPPIENAILYNDEPAIKREVRTFMLYEVNKQASERCKEQ